MNNTTNNNGNKSNNHFEKTLKEWITEEKCAVEFINVISKLWFDKSIELIIFRRQLLERSPSNILNKHSYAENIINKKLNIKDSLLLAKAILDTNIAPARIDIGRLNKEWTEEKDNYKDVNSFINDKLKAFINVSPRSKEYKDVILYGFGRIGRLVARELINIAGDGSRLRLRAIVTRNTDAANIKKRISLFRKDSVHGPFNGIAIDDADNKSLYINGHIVKMLSVKNPEDMNYEEEGITNALLIDNTGIFRDRISLSRHLKAKGVDKVLLTAPAKGDIPNIVYGVNQDDFDLNKEKIFSAASCTTNAIVPALSIIEKKIGIETGHIETIHSYTNDQNLLDNIHKKPRRGRSAALNMVLTSTGAGDAAVKIIPILKGKLTANAIRVPTPDVSLAILSLNIKKETSREEITELLRNASLKGNLIEQIRFSTSQEAVSSDFIGDSCAGIFDSPSTIVSNNKKNIIIYIWYDNEFGYTNQVIRLAKHISMVKSYRYY
ncbi:MAG: glyceraldehyde-3-phosphate dehydrogenase [Bacteroidales bacterium]|nr:glyceraldehyde-3-phosphate dehydrogenase [Bacteroidales bacterium]